MDNGPFGDDENDDLSIESGGFLVRVVVKKPERVDKNRIE